MNNIMYLKINRVLKLVFFLSSTRYADIHHTVCVQPSDDVTELDSDLVNRELSLWEPTYDYGKDSVFSVTPPTVSEESKRLYEASVRVGTMGPLPIPESSWRMYQEYAEEYKRMWLEGL